MQCHVLELGLLLSKLRRTLKPLSTWQQESPSREV